MWNICIKIRRGAAFIGNKSCIIIDIGYSCLLYTSRIKKDGYIEDVQVAGAGFINFYLSPARFYETLKAIEEQGEEYGRIDIGKGKRVMVEFVSANPTGPMHMGNARGGALGDCLASVLEYAGYE